MSGSKNQNGKRICSWCDQEKPATLEHFYRKRNTGLQAWCKACGWNVQKYQRDKAKLLRQERAELKLKEFRETLARVAKDR